jgi:lipoprotein-anchoring transpeptidase ErfK/SrfK
MAVDRALAAGDDLGTVSRFWHRFRDEPVQVGIRLRFRLAGNSIDGLVGSIADDVRVEPRDAAIGISDDHTDIALVHAKAGTKLAERSAAAAITSALRHHATVVDLKVAAITPKVTAKNLGPTIVVRVNENRLSLYDGFDVEQTWSVATAKPGYTTPTGVWNIYDKRENPTWYNPALDGWGADLPAVIPGGPGNPMGTRAIYIDAPGLIRIHGTTDDGSIGRYASHGCIRMHNSEVEDLFDRIPVGAHVVVVGFRPAEAGYWSVPPASDI